jgi:hypothetical protein
MEKLNTLVYENNLKLLTSIKNLETPLQNDFFEVGEGSRKKELPVNATPKARARWAKDFVNNHELSFSNLKNCAEFYKLNKSEQDSVRYQLKRNLEKPLQNANVSNLTRQPLEKSVENFKSTQISAKAVLEKTQALGTSILLYVALVIVLGLLTAESITYYQEARGMVFQKAFAVSLVVELLLVLLFSSSKKQIKILAWMLFAYSTATCGLWILHQDAKRSEVSQEQRKLKESHEQEIEDLRNKIKFTEQEIELLVKTQSAFLNMGHLSKSLRVGEEILRKKEYLSSINKSIQEIRNTKSDHVTILKAGAFEADSYSQFALRIILQLFVANFSLLKRKEKSKRKEKF